MRKKRKRVHHQRERPAGKFVRGEVFFGVSKAKQMGKTVEKKGRKRG